MTNTSQHIPAPIDPDQDLLGKLQEQQDMDLDLALCVFTNSHGEPDLNSYYDEDPRSIHATLREISSSAHDVSDEERPEFYELMLRFQMIIAQELARRGDFDGLTGVFNKVAFTRKVDELIEDIHRNSTQKFDGEDRRQAGRRPRQEQSVSRAVLFMIDLDGFKKTNDDIGHDAGDAVLMEVAKRLEEDFPGSFAGRLGGDEFALCLPIDSDKQATTIHTRLEQLLDNLSIEVPIPHEKTVVELRTKKWHVSEGRKTITVPIRGSVGMVPIDPKVPAKDNLGFADQSMYAMKQQRKKTGHAPVR